MNTDLLVVALITGAANWAFRVLPTLTRTDRLAPGGRLEQFLAATGPAAIATLFVASVLPLVSRELTTILPGVAGTLAVVGVYLGNRSVVAATLAGAVVYGMAFGLLA
jgi:hypothetical protein